MRFAIVEYLSIGSQATRVWLTVIVSCIFVLVLMSHSKPNITLIYLYCDEMLATFHWDLGLGTIPTPTITLPLCMHPILRYHDLITCLRLIKRVSLALLYFQRTPNKNKI